MELNINVGLVKQLLKKHPNEAIADAIEYRGDDRMHAFEIDEFNDAELETLQKLVDANPNVQGCEGVSRKLATFKNIKKDPGGAKVKKVESLEQAFRLVIAKLENHWLFLEDGDYLVPYYVHGIDYEPYCAKSQTPAHTTIRMSAISRGEKETESRRWQASDLRGSGSTVSELLLEAKLYVPTPELLAQYRASMERFKAIQPLTGEQFTATGDGQVLTGKWRQGKTAMVRDGNPAKLVMDDESKDTKKVKSWTGKEEEEEIGKYGDDDGLADNGYWLADKDEASSIALPIHPYVRLFDLDLHDYVVVHSDQLTEYKWNPALGDKLILPPDHKEVVTILMDTASEEIDDIIAGKSGGTIVICTGEPGTGKTLTAEVTSEVIKRPLYKVHCSQLGTDEEVIEKELSRVLNRATRWKALLLIDEADVYIRSRGTDIQQNAIVGVFLRILEYYRGVLFMTSNMATVIDDAIMSRATVHLKYVLPSPPDLKRIWQVLAVQFKLKMPDTFIDTLVRTFPNISGRDVKALLKLAIRYSRKKDNKITIELFKLLAVHKDITPV